MPCEFCTDGDGGCCYPYYGLAPHNHDLSKTGCVVGSTVFTGEPLPENFEPDPDDPDGKIGTYTHCPKCGCNGT